MCSYNKINGEPACESDHMLNHLLREWLGFKGFVMSDWGAIRDGPKAARSGMNVEMPEAEQYKELAARVPVDTVDSLAGQVLTALYATGQVQGRGPAVDWSWPPPFLKDTTSADHLDIARRTIIESTVLLKNREATLPLKQEGLRIVMVGKACHDAELSDSPGSAFSGGGDSFVVTTKTVTPLAGMRNRLGASTPLIWSPDGMHVTGANVAVVCAAAPSREGVDREDLVLPEAEALVGALRRQGGMKIVVLAIVPGAITTEWIEDVDAALVMFMPGEQVGPALAELLMGDSGPGGRLPVTFPKVGEKRFTGEQYPGVSHVSQFSEGVLVGHRWNDATGVPAAFPFGFGLSYTSFVFSEFEAQCNGTHAQVALVIANTGRLLGAAVPQLYVSFPSLQPVKRQLRGFAKASLPAGRKARIIFHLEASDWSFFDEDAQMWRSALDGQEAVTVSVGSSSAELHWNSALVCPVVADSTNSARIIA